MIVLTIKPMRYLCYSLPIVVSKRIDYTMFFWQIYVSIFQTVVKF